MAENSIEEWLAEYKNLNPVEVPSFASSLIDNHELIHAIFNVLEDKVRQYELLEPVCNQLFSFYRSNERELQYFVIQYVPTLIGVYLATVGQPDVQIHRAIKVLILGIYNLDVVNAHGKPHTHSFQFPSLAQPSIYHESSSTFTTTDTLLRGMDKTELHVVTLGPFPQVDILHCQNRLWVMTILMNIYNANLSFIPKPSLRFMCRMCSRLAKQGFARQGHLQRSSYGSETLFANLAYQRANQRIPLNSAFLLELLHAIYFAMYNGHYQVAVQALEDIHIRAAYELFGDVLLVTNAIRSSLKLSPSGQALEEPMGINVALSPSTATPHLTKAIITNASFRTKKLPDDIPIQESEKPLTTISEEQEEKETNEKEKVQPAAKKISVGSLIAKAKGMRKDESSPSSSNTKSKEKIETKKQKVSTNDSSISVKLVASKLQNGELMDTGKLPESKSTKGGKVDDKNIEMTRSSSSDNGRKQNARRLSDGLAIDLSKSSNSSWSSDLSRKSESLTPTDIRFPELKTNGRQASKGDLVRTTDIRRMSDPKISNGKSLMMNRKGGLEAMENSLGKTANGRSSENFRRTEDAMGDISWISENVNKRSTESTDFSRKSETLSSRKGGSEAIENSIGKSDNCRSSDNFRRKEDSISDTTWIPENVSRRSDESGVAVIRLVDGKIKDIIRPDEISNGDSIRLNDSSAIGRLDAEEDEIDEVPQLVDQKKMRSAIGNRLGEIPRLIEHRTDAFKFAKMKKEERIGEPHCTRRSLSETKPRDVSLTDDGVQSLNEAFNPAFDGNVTDFGKHEKIYGTTDGKHEMDPRRVASELRKQETNIKQDSSEPKIMWNRLDVSDSSEETEQSYSLDMSYTCSNFTDSEEEISSPRPIEQKVQRESLHTFV